MKRSEDVKDIVAALAAAQLKIGLAKKTSANPHYKSKYADLAEIWDTCHVALNEQGICIVQTPDVKEGSVTVETAIVHSSGQWMCCDIVIPIGKPDAHGIGSAITYGRRYGLASLVGVCPEDDDGQAAAESVVDLGKEWEPRLSKAAQDGLEALAREWNAMPAAAQKACQPIKAALKIAATNADRRKSAPEEQT